jgi:exopolysaccharide production protein ExoQ
METSLRRDALLSKNAFRLNRLKKGYCIPHLAWFSCFLSLLMLCLVTRIGAPATALFILPWGLLAARHTKQAAFAIIENGPLFLIPAYAFISFAWSDYPTFTLNASIQFILTIVIAIWAGSLVTPRIFISALLTALTIVNIAGLILDGGASFRDEGPLLGVFDSKNQLAFHALMQLLLALIVVIDRAQAILMRLIALAAIAVASVCLIEAQSTGAVVFGAPAIVLCLVLPGFSRLPLLARATIVAAVVVIVVSTVIAIGAFVEDSGAVLDALGKDSTLTGRSYLWQRAHDFINEAPLLGVGYQAFWRIGNPPAEELWAFALVESGAGFNFHNLYLHVAVDLGYIGMGLMILTFLWMAIRLCYALILVPSLPVFYAAALFSYMFTVSFIEVAILSQFSLAEILFCIIWVYSGVQRSYKSALHPTKRTAMPQ